MKKFKLTIAERLAAIAVFNNPENKVPTSDLKIYLDDVAKFRITDLDKETINWHEEKDKEGRVVTVGWDEKDAGPTDISLDDFTVKFLKEKLDKLEYSAADSLAGSVLTLIEKLK